MFFGYHTQLSSKNFLISSKYEIILGNKNNNGKVFDDKSATKETTPTSQVSSISFPKTHKNLYCLTQKYFLL